MEKREELYGIMADNIKKERKRLGITGWSWQSVQMLVLSFPFGGS